LLKKGISYLIVVLLISNAFLVAFNIREAKALGTTYIRADGSVDPPTAPISSADNVTYVMTDNVTSDGDGIVVERSYITIDGMQHSVIGPGLFGSSVGLLLQNTSGVTVCNIDFRSFCTDLWLNYGSDNTIFNCTMSGEWRPYGYGDLHGIAMTYSSNNDIHNNKIIQKQIAVSNSVNNVIHDNDLTSPSPTLEAYIGFYLSSCSNNNISENSIIGKTWYSIYSHASTNNVISANNIEGNGGSGVTLHWGSTGNNVVGNNIEQSSGGDFPGIYVLDCYANNNIVGNSLINNVDGIFLQRCSGTSIVENYIVNNTRGLKLSECNSNYIYHNNIINNTKQVDTQGWEYDPYINYWDNGYPAGGNYWSNYNGTDSYKGPNQDQPGSDLIGDTAYVVGSINTNYTDRYPLMGPWNPMPPNKLEIYDIVRATDTLNVRSGPGLRNAIVGTMLKGNKGSVLTGPVEADGYNWWKTSYDVGVTGWSADEWLELVPSRPQPPSDFTSWADATVNWAEQRMGNESWAGYGLRFVANAFMQEEGKPAGWASALDAATDYDHFDRLDQMLYGWREAPKGAVVFFNAEGTNPYGQVGIYLGNGSIIHVYGTVTTDSMEGVIGKPDVGQYLGWSYPPEAWRPTQTPNQPPVANAGHDRSVSSGELVAFDASASYDPDLDGTITGYRWNFGDGTTDEGKTVSHRFRGAQNGPKDYTVQLTVEDDHGATNSDSVLVTVNQLKKRVELSPTVLGSSYMETTYNWIGTDDATNEDLYIISRIDTCFGGIIGASQFFIVRKIDSSPSWKVVWHIPKPTEWAWNTASYTTPFTPSLWQELWGTPCKTSKHTFSDGTFEGINVTKNSFMLLVSSGAEIAIIMEYWDAGWAKFDPNSPATSLQLEQLQEFGEFSDVVDLLDKLIDVIFSPGELRVYDSQGRVTGLVNGVEKEEIPGSAYVNDTVIIFYPNETYRHEVVGLENGNYSLLTISVENGIFTTFKATHIPISTSALHQYLIDWTSLRHGSEGANICVDGNADDAFEWNFTSDSELTREEFLKATSPVEGFPYWIAGIVIGVTVILVAVGVLLRKRRKPQNEKL
jgi:parallel beta-helix repeat protein